MTTLVSYVNSGAENAATAGGNPTPGIPGSIQQDDMLLCAVHASVATAFATTAMNAAGFTRRVTNNAGGSSPVQALYYKRATGSESGTVTVTSPGGVSAARIFAFRGIDWGNPFGSGAAADQVFGSSTAVGTYGVPTQTPDISGCAAFMFAVANTATGTFDPTPTNYSEVWDSTVGAVANNAAAYYRLNLPVSATGTRNITRVSGTVRGEALGVILRPISDYEGWGVQL